MKYLAVGIICFSAQLIILTAMVHLGAYRPLANTAAFAASAQLNFLLSSKLTWRDRPACGWRHTGRRWAAYNATALLSLTCDSAVFIVSYRATGTTVGAALGVVTAACLTYLVCNRVVFRSRRLDLGQSIPVTAGMDGRDAR
jgi:putative flippase GtrA